MSSVATAIRKLSLSTSVQPKIHKKYLGDKDDLHFVPDSPLIERQFFTAEEEEELKRSCTRLLANVPHSDDMSDDPLKYIAAQIQVGDTSHSKVKQTEPVVPTQKADIGAGSVTQQFLDLSTSTAPSTQTPSSNRDTIDTLTTSATDFATPLTSAGITPGETARRHSDAARKSTASQKKPGSSLRNEASSKTKSRAASNAGANVHKSLDPNHETEAIKRTLRLVGSSSRPGTSSISSMKSANENIRPSRFSAPDLNKSLPPPPPAGDATPTSELDDLKTPHISRLMKSLRRKKSSPAITGGARSFSTSAVPPPMPMETVQHHKNHDEANTLAQALPRSEQSPVKKRFFLRLFKRERPADVLVS